MHSVTAVCLERRVVSKNLGSSHIVWCHRVTSPLVSSVVCCAVLVVGMVYSPTQRRKKKAINTGASPMALVLGHSKLLPNQRR